jgi:hypothetical protein
MKIRITKYAVGYKADCEGLYNSIAETKHEAVAAVMDRMLYLVSRKPLFEGYYPSNLLEQADRIISCYYEPYCHGVRIIDETKSSFMQKVTKCRECGDHRTAYNRHCKDDTGHYCWHTKKDGELILDPDTIPEWCPEKKKVGE